MKKYHSDIRYNLAIYAKVVGLLYMMWYLSER